MNDSGGAFSAASLERLQRHALFTYQIQDEQVRARVCELQEMLVGAKDEHDHFDILSELVYVIEDAIQDSNSREVYLLASLTNFTHEMEMLREVDAEAALNPADITGFASIFARESSKQSHKVNANSSNSRTSSSVSKQVVPPARSAQPSSSTAAVAASNANEKSSASATKPQDRNVAPVHAFFSGSSAPRTAPAPVATATPSASPKRTPRSPARSPGRSPRRSSTRSPARSPGRIQRASPRKAKRPVLALGAAAEDDDDDDLACAVCLGRDSVEGDPIVICELCSTAVHQTCYRIAFVPEGDWYCHPCARYLKEQDAAQNVTPTHELECVACLQKGGALMPTLEGAWMHMVCSMFLPEIFVKRVGGQGEVVCGVDQLAARRRLRCCFCKRVDKGACAQCSYGKCVISYHVLCALRRGIEFAFIEAQGHFGSGCLKHQELFLAMEGLNADDDGTAADAAATPEPRPTLSTTQFKELKTKVKKSRQPPNSKARESLWDGDGTEKDEHVLITSDSEADDLEDDRSESTLTPAVKASKAGAKSSSSKKRQLRLDGSGGEGESAPPVKFTKKARQSTLLGFAKPPSGPGAGATVASVATAASSATSTSARVTQSRVFVPAFYPPSGAPTAENDHDYEYVMVLIERQPLGLVVVSMPTTFGSGIFLSTTKCWNEVVAEALRRGVIEHLDEVFALNDTVLRNLTLPQVHDIIAKVAFPMQCWFRTKRRRASLLPSLPLPSSHEQQQTPDGTPQDATKRNDRALKALDESASGTAVSAVATSTSTMTTGKFTAASGTVNDGLSIDWPWFYLRSDGKIAMNLFWRSLDGAFFVDHMSKRTLAALTDKVEALVGVRLRRDHAEYDRVRELLVMPKRECTPAYVRAFRTARRQKKKFLSSDIFMGVSAEPLQADAAGVDEQTPIAVGTVVTVAKRTWAGINKLGGAGRVRRVHEQTLDNDSGGAKRFTYDIAYVLGGGEKKVERKYISVVDLNKETERDESTGGGTGTSAGASAATAAGSTDANTNSRTTADDAATHSGDADEDTLKVRLSVQVQRSDDETLVTALAALSALQPPPVPPRRVFAFEISTAGGNVQLTRKDASNNTTQTEAATATTDLLLHRHFDVKRSDEDAIVAASFNATLLAAHERATDGADDLANDDSASETDDGDDEIRVQLEALQRELGAVLASNEAAFTTVTATIEREDASKAYRVRQLEAIQWRHYEQMYRDIAAARDVFDASDDASASSDDGGDGNSGNSDDDDDDESGDESFGGLFVNRVKHEGDDVCVLCELSGGDFAATSCGQFVHPQCAMYTPETYFRDGVCHGVAHVLPARRALVCAICHGRQGLSKIQCASKRCTVAYHISCAFVNGLLIQDPHYLAWCPKHLKTSGMAHYVELPKHLQKATAVATGAGTDADADAKPHRKRASRGKKGRRETPRAGGGKTARSSSSTHSASASKTTKKRKRKPSVRTDSVDLDDVDGTDSVDDKVSADSERNCARRFDINADSKSEAGAGAAAAAGVASTTLTSAPTPEQVFQVNDVVNILPREWIGSNKPGGVARVRAVHTEPAADGTLQRFYDVAYVLTSAREKRVEAQYVQSYTAEQDCEKSSSAMPSNSRKKSRGP